MVGRAPFAAWQSDGANSSIRNSAVGTAITEMADVIANLAANLATNPNPYPGRPLLKPNSFVLSVPVDAVGATSERVKASASCLRVATISSSPEGRFHGYNWESRSPCSGNRND